MKATINRKLFLAQALPLTDSGKVTVMLHASVLSVASFGNTINFRVPASVVDPGQVFLSAEKWQELVRTIEASEELNIVLEIETED
jgi:hypothetical protein